MTTLITAAKETILMPDFVHVSMFKTIVVFL